MKRLSKQERKRLRKQYEDDVRQEVFPAVVVSPEATMVKAPPRRIAKEAERNQVKLVWEPVGDSRFRFLPPGCDQSLGCEVIYASVTEEMAAELGHLEDLRDEPSEIPVGAPCVELWSQINIHPVNNLIVMTLLRVLGRVTKGTLIDPGRNFIMDDWLSWSLDYMDKDMFKVQRVYDQEAGNPADLLREFPGLRKRRLGLF
jgi:hypothetical protein